MEIYLPTKTKIAVWWGVVVGLFSAVITIIDRGFWEVMMSISLILLSFFVSKNKIWAWILIILLLGGILFSWGLYIAKYLAELINIIPTEGNISDVGALAIFYYDILFFGIPLFLFLVDSQNFIRSSSK